MNGSTNRRHSQRHLFPRESDSRVLRGVLGLASPEIISLPLWHHSKIIIAFF